MEKETVTTKIETTEIVAEKKELKTAKKEAKLAKKREKADKPKRKFKKRYVVLITLAVLLIIYVIHNIIQAKNNIMTVTTEAVSKGDIEVIVTLSGTVESANVQTYYADISAPLASIPVKVGDRVNEGDILCTYSEDSLEKMRKQAELTVTQANGNYEGTIAKNAKATVALSGASMSDIKARQDEITAEVDAINARINEKMSRMNRTLTDLQKTAMDVDQNNISDSTDASLGNNNPVTRKTEDGHQMSLELQQAISEVQYALSYDPEITAWKDQINALNEEKAKLSEQASAEQSALTSGEKASMEAQKELTSLDANTTLEDIEKAQNGIISTVTGVVTEITAQEGSTTQKGTKVVTVAGTDDVKVKIQISKSDLGRIRLGEIADITIGSNSYEGEVTKISGTAIKNSAGVAVVDAEITVSDPGDSIILGVEASNKIHTDHAEDVLIVPYEYIGTDALGDYVYTIENNIITRRDITIGLSTASEAEVVEGLSEGDRIITTNIDTLVEGTPAIEDPDQ
ncbi:MAG: HlyD family efflux transporter periplasmic adaptor subunit [Lachnospiraceae bacterium]|nr:HlyD family efflux transporter periplasmic adaptor subunit [Lachnospiraceae bacterium]